MRKRYIIPTIILLIVGLGSVGVYSLSTSATKPVTQATVQPQSKYDVGAPDAGELLELVNAERAKYGVAPLVMDERLNQSAQMKADDMVTYNYFGHVNYDGTRGYEYAAITTNNGCSYASENIQYTPNGTSRDAFDAWVQSKPHHEAMIDSKHVTTGFGISHDDYIKVSEVDPAIRRIGGDVSNVDISVEHFCSPR